MDKSLNEIALRIVAGLENPMPYQAAFGVIGEKRHRSETPDGYRQRIGTLVRDAACKHLAEQLDALDGA